MLRTFLVGLILAVGVMLVGSVSAAAFEVSKMGVVTYSTMGLVAAALAGLALFLGAFIALSGPSSAAQCNRCEDRLFPTVRTPDRLEVLTCFGCGWERKASAVPVSA